MVVEPAGDELKRHVVDVDAAVALQHIENAAVGAVKVWGVGAHLVNYLTIRLYFGEIFGDQSG